MKYDIADKKLASEGKKKIQWAAREMGVLDTIEKEFIKKKPFTGVRLAACLHVTTETARLMQVLKAGGAQVILCASNPLSTKDDVAASLVVNDKIAVFARYGANRKQYYAHLEGTLGYKPHLTMDDGADLLTLLHTKYAHLAPDMYGSTEETTTGVIRLRALEASGKLMLPVVAVNDAQTKHFFDNRYGTGQSTFDGLLRATNVLIAGKTIVVAGYGWCGKGVALRARGLGAKVIVTEIDPVRALEANMDGHDVMTMVDAAPLADVVVAVTGNRDVVNKKVITKLKDQCIVLNVGHFDVEIDVAELKKMAKKQVDVRENVRAYHLSNGRTINLIAEGRLANLAAAEGHPSAVMDMSFAGQALAAEHLVTHGKDLAYQVYSLPHALDQRIAALKLKSTGIKYDVLTPRQKQYLDSWNEGT